MTRRFSKLFITYRGFISRTSGVAEALAVSVQSGPRALSLRRCYGLGPVSAGHLLAAAATDASRLQCIVLSHLDRLDFLQDSASLDRTDATGIEKELVNNTQLAKSIANLSRGAGLRLLALNNCGGLGMAELTSVVSTFCRLLFSSFQSFSIRSAIKREKALPK